MKGTGSPLDGRLERDRRRFLEASRGRRPADGAAQLFRRIVTSFYGRFGRDFPWRRTRDPYRILVSEFMLQQTQVRRVEPKYAEFLRRFPDFGTLSGAGLAEVLSVWQGLGYNRRAKALRETARLVTQRQDGGLPREEGELRRLPGVGPATAGAVRAFAFGLPAVFVETNIRRVYLHFFFPRRQSVADREVLGLVAATLDASDPRSWYYALMDYGAALKDHAPGTNRRSAHFRQQAPFEGSDRQVRSAAIRILLREGTLREGTLVEMLGVEEVRARRILDALRSEGFVVLRGGWLSVA